MSSAPSPSQSTNRHVLPRTLFGWTFGGRPFTGVAVPQMSACGFHTAWPGRVTTGLPRYDVTTVLPYPLPSRFAFLKMGFAFFSPFGAAFSKK